MANSPNFSSILDEAPTEVVAPTPIPQGTYNCIVTGPPRYDKSTRKGTGFVEFNLRPVSVEDDISDEALENCGGLDGKTIKAVFWETEDAIFMLDQFHEHCGLDLSEKASRRQRNDLVMNCEVRCFVRHEPSQDGQRIFARFARSLPMG